MSFTHQVQRNVYSNALNVATSETLEGDVEAAVSQDIDASAVNIEILVALDVSKLQSVVIKSSQDCTVKTNSSGSPDDTLTLVANVPYVWTINSYDASLITADVSKIFVTNGAAVAMTFQLLALAEA